MLSVPLKYCNGNIVTCVLLSIEVMGVVGSTHIQRWWQASTTLTYGHAIS